ncbi:protoporphyrinogen IX dehydrogenase [Candidatus Photodesmus katoptron]|uniref:Protoporphyrinogen IX dehydrogenase [quinone] n=1 Tax=Candidatus Photodesmus katoptron Akat1 TaxID=1236703 RepID=S3DZZ6_9GAMM|nr:menaquinone-dependent protoporphyrinogen IX dehydrogenase [Candidatus Photodesmus katoptron]EPE37541.1 protoporphyrinogen oxidase [Candidatus Photodesmus katoptron Akat1]KEY90191.1 protoporphyrinogen IX dehydrogenase [Candidatus Photodesmus katoptron]
MKVLLLYSTREGHTKKIIQHIHKELKCSECQIENIHKLKEIDLLKYKKILIGASIHYGHLSKELYDFLEKNYTQLKKIKGAFFCVNLTARKEKQKKDTPEGSTYIKKFLKKSSWEPQLIGVFAGELCYHKYRWFDRIMIKIIMFLTGGITNTSKSVEYTNWKKVSLFAKKFNKLQ